MNIMTVASISRKLAELRSPNAFNPYGERCSLADLPDGPAIRLRNFEAVLKAAAESSVEEVWVALEPTYRGARRTGLAMTDDRHLAAHGRRFGLNGLQHAPRSAGLDEDTARIVWEALDGTSRRVFLWNVVPLHTHRPDEPFSLRRHNAAERRLCAPVLEGILDLLGPTRLIGVGYASSNALRTAGRRHDKVRHPARGGGALFMKQVLAGSA